MSWFTSWFRSSPSAPQSDSSPPVEPRPSPASALTTTTPTTPPPPPKTQTTPNPNRNKLLFVGGATFFAFSLIITRRAFARRRQRLPNASQFYTNAPEHAAQANSNVSGAREALEALHLATLNVVSFAMMATGGALWYLNINSLADARRMIRGGLGVDGTGRTEKEAEEEFEEWIATTLSRKEQKTASKEGGGGGGGGGGDNAERRR